MKEANCGKQMKSVWELLPPSREEKLFGKHPAQKPIALLERIILASSNEGDVVLDPFMGSGTTLVSALRLRRLAYGCEYEFQSVSLALRRICSELVQVEISVSSLQISVDLRSRSMDRSRSTGNLHVTDTPPTRLVRRDRNFHFVGADPRDVVFTVAADDMTEAWTRFHNSAASATQVLFVIKTETEIYLAQ